MADTGRPESQLGDHALRTQVVAIDERHNLRQGAQAEAEIEAGPGRLHGESAAPGVPPDTVGNLDVGGLGNRAQHNIAEIVVRPISWEYTPIPQAHAEIGGAALARP